MATPDAAPPPPVTGAPRLAVVARHLFAVAGFAVAQPVYEMLAREPAFLVAHRAGRADLVALVVLVSLGVPAAATLLVAAAVALGRRARRGAFHALLGGLVAVALVPAWSRLPGLGGWGAVAAAAVAAALAVAVYRRRPAARSFVGLLGLAALAFPVLFLADPEVRKLTAPATSTGGRPIAAETPVVLVVFDALPVVSLLTPERAIDAARFPHFARLAAESVWFRQTAAVATGTTYAVPAILAGRRPAGRRQPVLADYPDNLFTWLHGDGTAAGGYAVRAIEPLTRLAPEASGATVPGLATRLGATLDDLWVLYRHWLYPRELARALPPIADRWRDFAAEPAAHGDGNGDGNGDPGAEVPRHEAKLAMFEELLGAIAPGARRTVYFGHFLWPHVPFHYLPSGRFYETRSEQQPGYRPDDEWAVLLEHQRHLLQLGFVDRQLGRLIARLEETGLYDRVVLVVVADHGVAFQAGIARRDLTAETRAEILAVPLFVRAPGLAPEVRDTPAEAVDVLPTVAALLGERLPFAVDGVSLRAADRETAPEIRVADADVAAAIARKVARFGEATPGGEGESFYRLWAPRHRRNRLGSRLADLTLLPPIADGVGLLVEDAERFRDVEPGDRFVPARVTGWLTGAGAGRHELAVVVNGVVEAFTYGTAPVPGESIQRWSAMVREGAFRPGANDVRVLRVVAGPGDEMALRPFAAGREVEPYLGVRLGLDTLPDVRRLGLGHPETDTAGRRVAWTDGDAQVLVILRGVHRPRRLRVAIAATPPGGADVTVRVDGRVVFTGHVAETGMDRAFPITPRGNPNRLRLAIESTQPAEDADGGRRPVGVALAGLWLLGPDDP